ncbi:MAG: VOC family protein [Nitrososphaerota archaeon]
MGFAIDPRTRPGWVRLSVSDVERSIAFYREVLGMVELRDSGEEVVMGAGSEPLVALREQRGARPKPPRSTGLYHFAVLLPSRRELARAYLRISERWFLHGASDHLVSEALYLSDPDGHGIEVYADRPRSAWRRLPTGELGMDTLPLDLRSLLSELRDEDDVPGEGYRLPDGTVMGHVHLHVSRLERARAFYRGAIGMNVTFDWSRYGALFFAAGDYHHHVGANVWAGIDAPRPPPESVRLLSFSLLLPDERSLEDLLAHLRSMNVGISEDSELLAGRYGFVVKDQDGNDVELVVRG